METTWHFTYQDKSDPPMLCQGDILLKNDEICSIIKEVHPHYLKDDYKYFIVLTQSCDLVIRKKHRCKARYISLAAVRPLETALNREIESHHKFPFQKHRKLCNKNRRQSAYNFLESLLNNNHTDYFYLNEERNFSEPCCAFLRLSIAIKSELHYETCLKAKILELRPEFKDKLGWLVGNLYSKVGTPDWTPDTLDARKFKQKIDELLDKEFRWIDENVLKGINDHIIKNNIEEPSISKEQLNELIEEINKEKNPTVAENKKKVINQIFKIINEANALKDDVSTDKLSSYISSDPIFTSYIKGK